jgi:hypothetical protein
VNRLALPSLLVLLAACGGTDPAGTRADPAAAVVEVLGAGPGGVRVLIPDGSTTPTRDNGTDFGVWSAGTIGNPVPPKTFDFELRNAGTDAVDLPGTPHVEVAGPGAARFSVTDLCVTQLPGGTSMTFAVGFDGLGTFGPHFAEVTVHLDARDYRFAVTGETVPTGQH